MKLRWILFAIIGLIAGTWSFIKDNKAIIGYFLVFGLFLWLSGKVLGNLAHKTRTGPE